MRALDKILGRTSDKALKRNVSFDAESFFVAQDQNPSVGMRWADVQEVFAFKHDLYAVDEICLGFRSDSASRYFWAGEDDAGFPAFRAEAERRFSIAPSWFAKVAQPPFAENQTTLWRRS